MLDICELMLGRSAAHPADGRAVDLAEHGIEVVDKRLLGKGVFNDVHSCLLRNKAGTAARRIAIKQVKSQLFNGGPTTIQAGVGIDHSDPRLASRNIATSILDGFIGTAIVPGSSAILIDGQSYLAMTIAPGRSATRHYRADPAIIFDPVFQRRCNALEFLAYLSGNPDVHSGNILVAAAKRGPGNTDVQVTLIDNDLAFGPNVDNPDQMTNVTGNNKRQYRHTGLPAYVDINTASRIRSMDRKAISAALAPFLSQRESSAFEARLDRTLDHIAYLRRLNRVVFDWSRFANVQDEPLDGADFIGGTLEFAGVMQGRMGEEAYFSPRSVIVRDCLEERLGSGADLASLLGPDRHALLQGWARSVKKHVPPSGVDHR